MRYGDFTRTREHVMQIASDQVALYVALHAQYAIRDTTRTYAHGFVYGTQVLDDKVVSRLMTDCNARIEIITLIPRRYFTQ